MAEEKEIIIDGVNVAGCKDYDDGICCNDDVLTLSCEKTNCMYKQLKRLEQERDEWKKKYEDAANENLKEIYELIKKNDCWRGVVNVVCGKLEQENKELKEKIKDKPLQCLLYNDKQNKCALFTKTVAYHCVLKEIRESFLAFHQITIPFHVGDVAKLPHSLVDMISDYCTKIQNKIDEVLKDV